MIRIVLVAIGIIILCWLSCDKIQRDGVKEILTEKQRKADSATIGTLSNTANETLARQKEFEKLLKDSFNIVRDTVTNQPRTINVNNTNIGTARDVFIGSKN